MDEFPTILKARQFVRNADSNSIPVDIERLATAAKAKIKVADDLADDESGQTTRFKDKRIIIVNGNHRKSGNALPCYTRSPTSCLNCPHNTMA